MTLENNQNYITPYQLDSGTRTADNTNKTKQMEKIYGAQMG